MNSKRCTSYFILTLRRERLSVRVIGKHLSRVTLSVSAACHPAVLAACHWSLAGSGAFLAHIRQDPRAETGTCAAHDTDEGGS